MFSQLRGNNKLDSEGEERDRETKERKGKIEEEEEREREITARCHTVPSSIWLTLKRNGSGLVSVGNTGSEVYHYEGESWQHRKPFILNVDYARPDAWNRGLSIPLFHNVVPL
uniref:Uncharacterized protein n=1 Tax=Cacopsylla melanoneura TaxID=428564 RepID=A0A8D8RLA1_9HEMI